MRTEISLDKLSITAKLASGIDATAMNEYLSTGYVESKYFYTPTNFMYQHNFTLKDGSFFQYGSNFDNGENARLEFNPNNADSEGIRNIMKRLKYPKVTRIDYAVDYFGKDLQDVTVRDLVGRKEEEIRSRSKKRETLYIGSRKSDNFIRIYNKAVQMKAAKDAPEEEVETKEIHWRIEAVVKDFTHTVKKEIQSAIEIDGKYSKLIKTEKVKEQGYLFKDPFDCIEVYEKYQNGTEGLKTAEKAMLFYLYHNPDEWKNLSANTRKKYEQLDYIYNHVLMENQPSEIFQKEKDRLAHELEEWVKPAIENGRYNTGTITNIEYSMMFLRNGEKSTFTPENKPLTQQQLRVEKEMAYTEEMLEAWQEFKVDHTMGA